MRGLLPTSRGFMMRHEPLRKVAHLAHCPPDPSAARVEKRRDIAIAVALAGALAACTVGCGPPPPPVPAWSIVMEELSGALVSVWGTSATDVYSVGGSAGTGNGPEAWHYDGTTWTLLPTGLPDTVILWWVFGFEGGPVYMVGTGGTVVRYDPATSTFSAPETTPDTKTLFGVWGSSPTDLWTVGGNVAGAAGQEVAWHSDGTGTWVSSPLPAAADTIALFKVWGNATDDVWACGADGVITYWDGATWSDVSSGTDQESLFTVVTDGTRAVAVGGFGNGLYTEWDGSAWNLTTPVAAPQFNGVWLTATEDFIVGARGTIWSRPGGPDAVLGSFAAVDGVPALASSSLDFHAVWVDPTGGVWAVGGDLLGSFDRGVMVHREPPPPPQD